MRMLGLRPFLGILFISSFFLVLGQPTSLLAYSFSIDSFEVIKNGSQIFFDPFDDGAPPPSAPAFVSSNFVGGTSAYNIGGTFGPESGGKLTIDSSGAEVIFNFEENALVMRQQARLNTRILGDIDNGLRSDDTFQVTGIFDLILPETRNRYGIRLSDVSAAQEGSDILTVQVIRRADGTLVIQYRDSDDPGNTTVIVDEALLDTFNSQICLRLERPDAADNSIFASFAYINGGGGCGTFTTFANTADIFDGEDFTRAEFRALAPVPEPSALLLLTSGLLGLGAALARRKS